MQRAGRFQPALLLNFKALAQYSGGTTAVAAAPTAAAAVQHQRNLAQAHTRT